jgi:hypothetical protein
MAPAERLAQILKRIDFIAYACWHMRLWDQRLQRNKNAQASNIRRKIGLMF